MSCVVKQTMSRFIKSTYEYTKSRKDFGKEPLFQVVYAHILDSILPDKKEQKHYILRNPVHNEVQAARPQTENNSNTPQITIHEQGINHTEGGWPRDVHLLHEESVLRHRRRVMHEETYCNSVRSLAPSVEHYINQNNAIEMYQTYFANMPPQEPIEKYNIRVSNTFRDRFRRPVSCVVWTQEKNPKLAVSYNERSQTEKSYFSDQGNDCHIWDITCQTDPLAILEPDSACWQLAASPVDPEILIAGVTKGTVHIFDIRTGQQAVSSSSVYNSHRNPITALLYTHSRTNTEFYTGSADGQCLWWDMRDLSEPTHRLPISVRMPPGQEPDLSNAEGVSALQFDRALPTKFLCGTESGLVINGNRMGKTHSEILYSYWDAHVGAVRAVHRSICTPRMFITCGDWTVRVWSDEVRTHPIITTKPYSYQVTDVVWAPQRFSSYMAICENGVFYYWDLLRKCHEPVAKLHISFHALKKISPHTDGEVIAVGDAHGVIFLLQLSENMIIPGNRDKALMFQTYERETKREHILDTRIKEILLKKRTEEEEEKASDIVEVVTLDDEDIDRTAEDEYFKIVKEEIRQIEGALAPSDIAVI